MPSNFVQTIFSPGAQVHALQQLSLHLLPCSSLLEFSNPTKELICFLCRDNLLACYEIIFLSTEILIFMLFYKLQRDIDFIYVLLNFLFGNHIILLQQFSTIQTMFLYVKSHQLQLVTSLLEKVHQKSSCLLSLQSPMTIFFFILSSMNNNRILLPLLYHLLCICGHCLLFSVS